MKVHCVSNQNVNTKGLKICYDAEYRLKNAESTFVSSLFKIGRLHECNQFIDILVMKNLSFKIKEKANPFFCIKEPMHLKKESDKKLSIAAVYDGVETEEYLKGDKYIMGVEMDTVEEADEAIEKFKNLYGSQKISFIAKLIENYFVKTKNESYPTSGNRNSVVSLLMEKYGDIVV